MAEKKRVFLVCKSKNCVDAKETRIRCTISMPETIIGRPDVGLNNRKFCTMYSLPEIIREHNTPNWVISPDKPGQRKLIQKAKQDEQSFYSENPEFLEVI